MHSQLDIYRSAHVLIGLHGNEAPIHATMMADRMLERGDMDGKVVWLSVLTAVRKLLKTPADNEVSVH